MTTYTQRYKNRLRRFRGRILTDVFDQVLVGEHEDEILIWQEDWSGMGKRSKNPTSYTKRNKN